jgi:hypothetical protein
MAGCDAAVLLWRARTRLFSTPPTGRKTPIPQAKRTYGEGSLLLRGRTWWIQFSVDGKVQRESTKSRSKLEARKRLLLRQGEVANGTYSADARRVTFDDLAKLLENDYATQERRSWPRAQLSLSKLRTFFDGTTRALDITTDRVDQYTAARLADGAARGTVQNERAALKRCFSLARRKNLLRHAPAFAPSR